MLPSPPVETTHMTTHSDPTYLVHEVVHSAVGNMPGAVPNTSTYALTNVTLPFVLPIAERGLLDALRADRALAQGLNTFAGALTNEAVAEAHHLDFTPIWSVIPEEPD
jgi:alanine dehydrogenase